MPSYSTHPADVIRALRVARGENPGPPALGYQPSRAIEDDRDRPDPEHEQEHADLEWELKRDASPTPRGEPHRSESLQLMVQPAPIEAVYLATGTGRFMGYDIKLTEGELDELRQLLARVIVRQLDEQKAALRAAIPQKKR